MLVTDLTGLLEAARDLTRLLVAASDLFEMLEMSVQKYTFQCNYENSPYNEIKKYR